MNTASTKHGISNVYTEYQKLFTEVSVDIVTIATRADVRSEIIAHAIDAGVRGIHAEKPLAILETDSKFLKCWRIEGLFHLWCVYRRYLDVFKQAENLSSGELGDLLEVSVAR